MVDAMTLQTTLQLTAIQERLAAYEVLSARNDRASLLFAMFIPVARSCTDVGAHVRRQSAPLQHHSR